MPEQAHVIAGRCSTVFEGTHEQEHHGEMVVLIKPDSTVLVHDTDGYQPVAWLTRPESVTIAGDTVAASDGEQSLRVTIHETITRDQYPLGEAGVPVGECPECAATLIRANGALSCPGCDKRYPIPASATVLDDHCADCELPRVRVERGCSFVLCPDCDSLTERIKAAFDREWDCPDCDGQLRVLYRGRLMLGCEEYPDCETAYSFPRGSHEGSCECGLPVFETGSGKRCLDSDCDDVTAGDQG